MSGAETHEYSNDFYSYINAGSLASARKICPIVYGWLRPASLLDVGCGAGAWCKVWKDTGVGEILGVDGDYVDRKSLLIEQSEFAAYDLSRKMDLGRRFDMATSLEVAEHVPESSSRQFVENLTRHADAIMFSAAVPGQGGEFHINEKPLSYWRDLFEQAGYRCFDPIRPAVLNDDRVEPWYRYNTLLYVAEGKVLTLSPEILRTEIKSGFPIKNVAPLSWRMRNAVIGVLPEFLAAGLVKAKHAWIRRNAH